MKQDLTEIYNEEEGEIVPGCLLVTVNISCCTSKRNNKRMVIDTPQASEHKTFKYITDKTDVNDICLCAQEKIKEISQIMETRQTQE